MHIFTLEEENLLAIYIADTRQDLINELIEAMQYMDDEDMIILATQALLKLEQLSDAEFDQMEFVPVFEYDIDDE